MSRFWTVLIFLSFAISSNTSETNKNQKKSAAVVVGTVYCDKCYQQDNHFIAVECRDKTTSKPIFRQQVKTDIHGRFRVNLPFPVSKHLKKIKGCSVNLVAPRCSIATTATSSDLRLRSRKRGAHIFSAGTLAFGPTLCDHNADERISPFLNPDDPAFPPPIRDPTPSAEPPALGRLLPPLPPLPGIPFLPPRSKKERDGELSDDDVMSQPDAFSFPPNPFQPPPSLIPPLFPTPTPSIFPPLFPSPSPPPFFQLPLIPGLTPPPPLFPIPLPPFPFQPRPGFPGVPPAEGSTTTKTSSP